MTDRFSRSAAALAAWVALGAPAAAQARGRPQTESWPSGRIQQLIADQQRLLAIRDGEVLMFAPDGARLGRCGQHRTAARRVARSWAGAPDPSELLRDAGLPDDDSSLPAEELLEDEEARAPPPRAPPLEPVLIARALAASGTSAWAATSDGVYRVGAQRCARVALAGREVQAIAVGGDRLAVLAGDQLLTADLRAPDGDRGFGHAAALPSHARLLAVDAAGTVLVADESGVLSVDPAGQARRVLMARTDALAACGRQAAALASDGVYLWDGARFRLAGARPRARVLACGDAPQRRWLAGGLGLWSSPDGAAWTERGGWLGTTVAGVAAVAGRLWVTTEAGLGPVRLDDPLPGDRGPIVVQADPPARRSRAPSFWRWPTVTAALTVDASWRSASASARRTTTAFLLLRFPLDRPAPAASGLTELALERALRDADLARLELSAAAAGASAPDAVDADEMSAWRALAADEREALR